MSQSYDHAIHRPHKEIEAKILEVSTQDLKKGFRRMRKQYGIEPKFVYDALMHTTYLDFPDGRLKKEGVRERVRTYQHIDGREETEYERKTRIKNNGVKVSEELMLGEWAESNKGIVIREELLAKGMVPIREEHKRRIRYSVDTLGFVDHDHIFETRNDGTKVDIPPFIEIEAVTEKAVFHIAHMLGYKPRHVLPWSGRQLVEQHYGWLINPK